MYLRITKQLSQIDAERIRNIKEKEQSLRNIKDFKFLTNGLKLKNIFNEKRHWYEALSSEKVFKCYGSFNLPKYRIIEWTDELGYCERNEKNKIWRRSFNLMLGDSPSSFGEMNLNARIFQDDLDAEEYTLHFAEGDKSNIFSIASYFYNKRNFYNKIHAFLEKNGEKFRDIMGEGFILNLISLFSSDKQAKDILNYNLSSPNKYETFTQSGTLLPKEGYLHLCFSKIFSLENKYGMDISIHCFLGEDNALVMETVASSIKGHVYSILEGAQQRAEKKNGKFNETIYKNFMEKYMNKQLNDCLTSMEKMINFGFDIYETVKTKLLINNL
jgi:hypothetical protein